MTSLVVYIAADIGRCRSILDVWTEAGAPGITILDSTGLGTILGPLRDDLPLLPSLRDILATQESEHRTLFTVVENDEAVKRIVEATRQCVGDFDAPDGGVLFVLPVSEAYGITKMIHKK